MGAGPRLAPPFAPPLGPVARNGLSSPERACHGDLPAGLPADFAGFAGALFAAFAMAFFAGGVFAAGRLAAIFFADDYILCNVAKTTC